MNIRATPLADEGGYLIEAELPCINGLSAWFSLAKVWATDFSAVEMTDGMLPEVSDTAKRIVSSLNEKWE